MEKGKLDYDENNNINYYEREDRLAVRLPLHANKLL